MKQLLKPRSIKLTHLWVNCTEAPKRCPALLGKHKRVFLETDDLDLQCDPDHAMRCAESFRVHAERAWGGKWIVVRENPPGPRAFGSEGRDLAFADILNGPDNKTRRWLVEYLEGQYPDITSAVGLKTLPEKVDINKERNKQRRALGFK